MDNGEEMIRAHVGVEAVSYTHLIRSLIRELDPRGFLVRSVTMPTQEERRWPFLKRHFEAIPEQGKILFLDSGWMDRCV